jgi:transposase
MLGTRKRRCLDHPIRRSLEELVSPDDFDRYLDATLDLGFVREWVRDCYAERGRPSIDPVVFFKLQLVMFFEGVRSERQLMRVVADRLSVRWYLGYDFDEPLPDHSSLTRIRTRLGLPVFQRFFEQVVQLCQQAGLVWGKELFFDATQVRANAHVDTLMPRWYLTAKAHLDELFPGHAEGLEQSNPAAAAPEMAPPVDETAHVCAVPPFAGSPEENERLAAANASAWRLLERFRLNPARPTTRGYHRTSDEWESLTDPDAAPMKKGGPLVLGYHDHYVVDGGKARIILGAFVTPGDVMENNPMLDLLWRVRFRWHLHPKRVVGDATYGTIENIRAVEAAGIRAYQATRSYEDRTPFFSASRFQYDATHDEYRCPQDHALRFERVKWTEDVRLYRADATTCNACPLKTACRESKHGRILHRSLYADDITRVKGYVETAAYQKAMRKRAVWVEPLFGEAKQWHNLRWFRLRRLWRVNTEALLVAAGQNLKRWISKMGWGRRHGPAGSLALSHSLPQAVFAAVFS